MAFPMRLLIEDIVAELKLRLDKEKSIRNKVWLKDAISNLQEYKKATEKSQSDA